MGGDGDFDILVTFSFRTLILVIILKTFFSCSPLTIYCFYRSTLRLRRQSLLNITKVLLIRYRNLKRPVCILTVTTVSVHSLGVVPVSKLEKGDKTKALKVRYYRYSILSTM